MLNLRFRTGLKVNGAVEMQRGKKLYDGDKVEYDGETVTITK